MVVPNAIEVYEEIKPALGEKAARNLVDLIQGALVQNLAAQSDIRDIRKDIEGLRKEVSSISKQIGGLYTLGATMFLALIGFWGTILLAIYLSN